LDVRLSPPQPSPQQPSLLLGKEGGGREGGREGGTTETAEERHVVGEDPVGEGSFQERPRVEEEVD